MTQDNGERTRPYTWQERLALWAMDALFILFVCLTWPYWLWRWVKARKAERLFWLRLRLEKLLELESEDFLK